MNIGKIFNNLVFMDIDNEGPVMRGLEAARQGPRVWTLGQRSVDNWTECGLLDRCPLSCLHASRWRPVAEMDLQEGLCSR